MPAGYDEYGTLSPSSGLYQPSAYELARNRGVGDRPGYSRLGSSIGDMIFGGAARDAATGNAFVGGAGNEVKLQDALMKARAVRDAEIGRQSMAAKYMDTDPDLANLILQDKGTLNGMAEYRAGAQKLSEIKDLWAQANSANPDMNRFSRGMIVVGGKAVPMSTVQGDTMFNEYMTPGTNSATTTELGKSKIGAEKALEAEHYAQAERAKAAISSDKAGFYDNFTDNEGNLWQVDKRDPLHPVKVGGELGFGSPMYKPGTQPKPPDTSLKPSHLSREAMVTDLGGEPNAEGVRRTDPGKLASFTQLQQNLIAAGDPDARNSDYVMGKWLEAVGHPGEEPPPGAMVPPPGDQSALDWIAKHGGQAPSDWLAARGKQPSAVTQSMMPPEARSATPGMMLSDQAPPVASSDLGGLVTGAAPPAAAAPAAPVGAKPPRPKNVSEYRATMRAAGSKMSDEQLGKAYQERFGGS
jgi:hypothetical protein